LKIKKTRKNPKNTKNIYFLMSVASLYTPCFVMFCVFLYGPFCHGAHKLDFSTLFTTIFLWTSLPFIHWEFNCNYMYIYSICYNTTFWKLIGIFNLNNLWKQAFLYTFVFLYVFVFIMCHDAMLSYFARMYAIAYW